MDPGSLPVDRRARRAKTERLEAVGVHETERNIANKISRGGFSAVFFVQCLEVIGAMELSLRR